MLAILIDVVNEREVTLHGLDVIPRIGEAIEFRVEGHKPQMHGVMGVKHVFMQQGKQLKKARIEILVEPLERPSSIVQANGSLPPNFGG